jgi:hypothetical protein
MALRDKEKENPKHRLDEEDVNEIFGNIEQLFRLNKALYEELEKRMEQWETYPHLGDIFKVWVWSLSYILHLICFFWGEWELRQYSLSLYFF